MKRSTKELFVKLKELTGRANSDLYQRVKLASEIFADSDWISEVHSGDLDKAVSAVESEFFADVRGFVTLETLANVFKMFPAENQWREYRYDLAAMVALYDDAKRAEKPSRETPKRASLKQVQELETQLSDAEKDVARERTIAEQARSEVETLRRENRELREEVAMLKGRIAELERIRGRELAAA